MLAGRGIQCAEAEVAVGLKGAHAEFVGEGEGLVVVGFSLRSIRRLTTCGDLAEATGVGEEAVRIAEAAEQP